MPWFTDTKGLAHSTARLASALKSTTLFTFSFPFRAPSYVCSSCFLVPRTLARKTTADASRYLPTLMPPSPASAGLSGRCRRYFTHVSMNRRQNAALDSFFFGQARNGWCGWLNNGHVTRVLPTWYNDLPGPARLQRALIINQYQGFQRGDHSS